MEATHYLGELRATSGSGWACTFRQEVEAESPEEARSRIRAAWQAQSTQPGMHIQEIRLWRDGQPLPWKQP